MKVIEGGCLKYACDCTVKDRQQATATDREARRARVYWHKSSWRNAPITSLCKVHGDGRPSHHCANGLVNRQEKMFEGHGIDISRKTIGGWMAQCAELLDPLYQLMKKELFGSKLIGTRRYQRESAGPKLPFARIGRIWPYVGDIHHLVILYDYTPTRGRTGPAKFLEGYTGYLQADAYSVYDAFFKPERGLVEVGCWMHARRYLIKALETDEEHMGPALHLIARLYSVEESTKALAYRLSRAWNWSEGVDTADR